MSFAFFLAVSFPFLSRLTDPFFNKYSAAVMATFLKESAARRAAKTPSNSYNLFIVRPYYSLATRFNEKSSWNKASGCVRSFVFWRVDRSVESRPFYVPPFLLVAIWFCYQSSSRLQSFVNATSSKGWRFSIVKIVSIVWNYHSKYLSRWIIVE